jgi:xylan 1,4-beta-xylosidase
MPTDRRAFIRNSAYAAALAALPTLTRAQSSPIEVVVDTRRVEGPLPHIWEECAGSDRAAITLRETWRKDLERWKAEAGLKRVRFHGIFSDELGVYAASILNRGRVDAPNWQNIDLVYDGLVERGVSPLIELSFMPKQLASGKQSFGFYAANISPPKSIDAWADFIKSFVAHLVERYGLAAVRTWPFEVWNEPNLSFFWSGTQQQYFDLYKATAVAIKSIDASIQVGGPATSRTAWLTEFMDYCSQTSAPLDFLTTHAYAGDAQDAMFGEGAKLPQADVIPEAVRLARQKIDASAFRGRPLWLTEWSSDSPAMIAHVIKGCLPHCQALSHWVMSTTYEELGVAEHVIKENDPTWGLMARNIAKPGFNTYKLLHALGGERLQAEGPALASIGPNKKAAALVWNLADVTQPSGLPLPTYERTVSGVTKQYRVTFAGAREGQRVKVQFVDQERGSPLLAWRAMGSPRYPTLQQVGQLRASSEIPAASTMKLDAARQLMLDLPPEGVALIELV